ncbi:MAG: MBL fold metallo-hydrolase [Chloroflexi bacterium]|nr:MBL fold metallo-hydrolase [Chloroflexota bacterium]
MPQITTITTPFILNITVNCYLVNTGDGFILIDTAKSGQRRAVETALEKAGCRPGNLRLIILTHGDFDHCGNAAYLRRKFVAPIALHPDDSGMVERGDMLWKRKQPRFPINALMGLLFRLAEADRFTPDCYIKEGDDFSAYGFEARVIELPGHSKGNIGLLTAGGDLFCGDLLGNTGKPAVWSLVDDPAAMSASVEKLNSFDIHTVYPGHGQPFTMAQFRAAHG